MSVRFAAISGESLARGAITIYGNHDVQETTVLRHLPIRFISGSFPAKNGYLRSREDPVAVFVTFQDI